MSKHDTKNQALWSEFPIADQEMIPVVDYQRWQQSRGLGRDDFESDLLETLRRSSFVILRNHGIPSHVLKALARIRRDFWNYNPKGGVVDHGWHSAIMAKRYPVSQCPAQLIGYFPLGTEIAAGETEPNKIAYTHHIVGGMSEPRTVDGVTLPATLSIKEVNGYSHSLMQYAGFAGSILTNLLFCLRKAAGLPHPTFSVNTNQFTVVRDIFGPAIRAGKVANKAHLDINLLTALVAMVEGELDGLQIKPPGSEQWHWAKVPFGGMLVNSGELLRLFFPDIAPVEHRVISFGKDRYSCPVFLNGSWADKIPEQDTTIGGYFGARMAENVGHYAGK